MGPLTKTVVILLVVTSTAICTPFINKLEPGQEWPERSSVKQPNHENIEEATEELVTEKVSVDDVTVSENDEPEITATLKAARATEDEKKDYSGAQLWKVSTNKPGVRLVIGRLGRRQLISTWGGNQSSVDILVPNQSIDNVTRVFKREDIKFDVVIDDLQKRINEENPPLDANELELQDRGARAYNFWRYRASHRRLDLIGAYMGYNSLDVPMEYWPNANWGHRMTWKQYHRLDDIYGFMDYLAKTYPSIVSVKNIGKSYENWDLKVLRISNGKSSNKAVFIDGGIHAREWISPATVTYFINQFVENFDVESDDVKNIDWYFMPVVNPDGYEHTHTVDRLWRKNRRNGVANCRGTDLNRNFGYRWGGRGASAYMCSEIYRGSSAFSEPESQAMSDFIKNSAADFVSYVTYHSYGQYLLYPWGYNNVVPPDYKDLDRVGNEMAEAIKKTGGSEYKVGSSSGLLYPASGGSDDWAKSRGIKYSYTIELNDQGRYGFVLPATYIESVARENLAGLRVLARQINKEFINKQT